MHFSYLLCDVVLSVSMAASAARALADFALLRVDVDLPLITDQDLFWQLT
jgi:hypothetical protein